MSFATEFAMPGEPILDGGSKKRKRPSKAGPVDAADAPNTSEPSINIEKLLKKYHSLEKAANPAATEEGKPAKKPKQQRKITSEASLLKVKALREAESASNDPGQGKKGKQPAPGQGEGKRKKMREKKAAQAAAAALKSGESPAVNGVEDPTMQVDETPAMAEVAPVPTNPHLTDLQQKMKSKLGGARFRQINEQLYTTSGKEALELMQSDPNVFDEYHTGFRSQASTWPSHPLDIIITSLRTLPDRSLIVDLGCGDARLAQDLASTSLKVLSYDLVKKNEWVQVAQCSAALPLPKEIADCVVCCLSLMGTDWLGQIRESARLLRKGGTLKIAEVSSRFTDVPAFEKVVAQTGFKLQNKDDSNTHFILFDFVRTEGKVGAGKKAELEAKDLLKPCLYKKRGA